MAPETAVSAGAVNGTVKGRWPEKVRVAVAVMGVSLGSSLSAGMTTDMDE